MTTKRFPLWLGASAALALAVLLTGAALAQSGGLNLDGYCRSLGYNGVQLDPTQQNVFGWGCLRSDGTRAGMDLMGACRWQYGGALPYPEYTDYNNAYSWFCSAQDLGSPVQNKPPEYVPPAPTPTPAPAYVPPVSSGSGSSGSSSSGSSSSSSSSGTTGSYGSSGSSGSSTSTGTTSGATYTVVRGDTLWRISRRFGTNVDTLVALNRGRYPSLGTNPNYLRVGWVLMVSGGSSGTPGQNDGEVWARISANAVFIPHPIVCAPESVHAWVQFSIPGAVFRYEGMQLESTSSYGQTLAAHSQLLWEDPNTNPRVIRMGLSCWDIFMLSPYQALVLNNRDKWALVYRVR